MELKLRELLDQRDMVGYQWIVICLCMALSIVDGFDVMVMAFTAASVSAEWGLSGSQLGLLLSVGLIGMALGSIFLSPLADKYGRRPLILCCLLVSGTSMVLAAWAQSAFQLGILRLITGIGVGGILASCNVLASEYASNKWRSLAVSLQATGYAIGATIGGIIAVSLIGNFGWRSVFLTGGSITLLMAIIAFYKMPESIDYLLVKQPKDALKKINQLTEKLKTPPLQTLPAPLSQAREASNFNMRLLFKNGLAIPTLALWFSFFLVMFGYYFVMSWTPKILSSTGMSTEQGVTIGILLSAGGILGTALIGFISARIKIFYVQSMFLLLTALFILALVNFTHVMTLAVIFGLCLGIVVNGCIAGLYSMSPIIYGAEIRTTGVGCAIGFGRSGAIVSPIVAGNFLDSGMPALTLYSYYAIAFVAAIFVVLFLAKLSMNTQKTQLLATES